MRECMRWIMVRHHVDAGRSARTRREIGCFIGMARLNRNYTEYDEFGWLTLSGGGVVQACAQFVVEAGPARATGPAITIPWGRRFDPRVVTKQPRGSITRPGRDCGTLEEFENPRSGKGARLREWNEIVFADTLQNQESRRGLTAVGNKMRALCTNRIGFARGELHLLFGVAQADLEASLDNVKSVLDVRVAVPGYLLREVDRELGDPEPRT